MRKALNITVLYLFVLGFVAAPALHTAAQGHGNRSCAHRGAPCEHPPGPDRSDPEPHRADQCDICKLAHAPAAAAVPVVVPTATAVIADLPPLASADPSPRATRLLPFSCGPPA